MLPSLPVSAFINPAPRSREHNAICNAEKLGTQVWFIGQFAEERYFRAHTPNHERHTVVLWEDDLSGDLLINCDCPAHRLRTGPDPCVHVAVTIECAKAAAETGLALDTIQGQTIGEMLCKAT